MLFVGLVQGFAKGLVHDVGGELAGVDLTGLKGRDPSGFSSSKTTFLGSRLYFSPIYFRRGCLSSE